MSTDEYGTNEFCTKAGISKSTAVRMEQEGVFQPRPKRRKRTQARIWMPVHVEQAKRAKDETEDPPDESPATKGAKGKR